MGLRATGFDVIFMQARQVNAALSVMRNKTDKTDACGNAQKLRPCRFSPVYIKSREADAFRDL
jgi:transposase